MTEPKPPPLNTKANRLAQALRDNLRRRKAGSDTASDSPPAAVRPPSSRDG